MGDQTLVFRIPGKHHNPRPPRQLSAITFTLPLSRESVSSQFGQTISRWVPYWVPNVTVGSDRKKKLVPQWGIEPHSLAFWASVITARPPRPSHYHEESLICVNYFERIFIIHTQVRFIRIFSNIVHSVLHSDEVKKILDVVYLVTQWTILFFPFYVFALTVCLAKLPRRNRQDSISHT